MPAHPLTLLPSLISLIIALIIPLIIALLLVHACCPIPNHSLVPPVHTCLPTTLPMHIVGFILIRMN